MSQKYSSKTTLNQDNGHLYAAEGLITVKDIEGSQRIDVKKSAILNLSNLQGNNAFYLEGASGDYQISASGSKVTLQDNAGGSLTLVFGSDQQTLLFADGYLTLAKNGKNIALGDQLLSKTLSPISAILSDEQTSAGLFGGAHTVFDASSSVVKDGDGDDSYEIGLGAGFKLTGTKGSNTFNLQGSTDDYTVKASGKTVMFADNHGGSVSLTIAGTSQQVVFNDAQYALSINGKTIQLGDQILDKDFRTIDSGSGGSQQHETDNLSGVIADSIELNPDAANGLRDGVDGNILWTKKKAASGKKNVDGILISKTSTSNKQWETSLVDKKTEISFSFAEKPPKYGLAYDVLDDLKASFVPLNDIQKQLARQVLEQWSEVVPLSFAERQEPAAVGDIRWFGSKDGQQIGTATALAPSDELSAAAGDIWIGPNYPEQYNDPQPGGYGYQTFLHEVGHVLGLIHPHDAEIPSDSGHDQLRYTVMSYRDFAGDDLNGYDVNRFFPTTPMLDDIAALQYLYGANWNYHPESNTYTWPADKPVFETVWDGGGVNDTFDGSNQTQGVIFNLNPGEWSTIGQPFWDGQQMVRNGLTIAYGTEIENAIGSDFNDTLIGNPLPNRFTGGEGNDQIYGDGGQDIAVFNGERSGYQWTVNGQKVIITDTNPSDGDDGTDILFQVETLLFQDGEANPPLTDDHGVALITHTTLIDKALPGTAGNFKSHRPVFSADGKWLAFVSDASNLAVNDANGKSDILVKNLATGEIIVASLAAGAVPGNGDSDSPVFSPSGTWLMFDSNADNLLPGDTNGQADTFIKNLDTGRLLMLNSDVDGMQGDGSVASWYTQFSPDAKWVYFSSLASNLVNGDQNSKADFFLKNLENAQVLMMNSDSDGKPGNGDNSGGVFSQDGRWILFTSSSSNLVVNDNNTESDVFVKDLTNGKTVLANSTANGTAGDSGSGYGALSPTDNFVAFASDADNLIIGDTNQTQDIFLKDLVNGDIKLVSRNQSDVLANAQSSDPAFSPDGKWLGFTSYASNLAFVDQDNVQDVFRKNLETGEIELISCAAGGEPGDADSDSLRFAPGGNTAIFHSMASNLVSGDNNGDWDVFLKNLGTTGQVMLLNSSSNGAQGDGSYNRDWTLFSPDGQWVAFSSKASNLVTGDNNGDWDLFVKNTTTGKVLMLNSSSSGIPGNNVIDFYSYYGFSPDGQWFTFTSKASNLIVGDNNQAADAFVKNLNTGEVMRLNSDSPGQGGSGGSRFAPDSHSIVFNSDTSNLTSGDTNGTWDVFEKNLSAGTTTLISALPNDVEIGSQGAKYAVLSPDSTRVAFISSAANLVLKDNNAADDLFLADLNNGQIQLLSATADGSSANGGSGSTGWSDWPIFSPDGQWLGFFSYASNLVTDDHDQNQTGDWFVKNLSTDQLLMLNSDAQGVQGNDNLTGLVPITFSLDGQWVMFSSKASNLVPGDNYGTDDVFLKKLPTGKVMLLNSASDGQRGDGPLTNYWYDEPYTFSEDSRYMLFVSSAKNLVPNDNNNGKDIFLKDLATGTVKLVSEAANGAAVGNGWSYGAEFSPDGQAIVFVSSSSNLVEEDDLNSKTDIFLKNIATGAVQRLNLANNGSEALGDSGAPTFSPDGKFLAFESDAANLVLGDNNGRSDIFIKNLTTGVIELVSTTSGGLQGNGHSSSPVFSSDGEWLQFNSYSSNFTVNDRNGSTDIFIKNLLNGKVFMINSASDGTPGNSSFDASSIKFSPDMQWVAFASSASNLVVNDLNGHSADIFLKNLHTGETQLLYVASDGTLANSDTDNRNFYFSPDSQSVLFASSAYNLVPGDFNGGRDVFIKQLSTGAIQRLTEEGTTGSALDQPMFTDDGQYIVMTDNHNLLITPNPYWLG